MIIRLASGILRRAASLGRCPADSSLMTERSQRMSLRHRRDERREEREVFDRGGTAARYQMRQKILSIGDD